MTVTIPFSVPLYEGLGETKGLLSLDGGDLLLEYQNRDALIGLWKSGP